MHEYSASDSGPSVVAIVTVADLPMTLDQMVDSCHSLALSGFREALVPKTRRGRVSTPPLVTDLCFLFSYFFGNA